MPIEDDMMIDEPKDDLSNYPIATLLAEFVTLLAAVVLVAGQSDLTYEQFSQYALTGWAILAGGRALAAKPPHDLPQSPLSRFLNQIPHATVMIALIALTGAVVLVVGESSLAFDEYFSQVIIAAGALGLARGAAAYKKDTRLPLAQGVQYAEPIFDPQIVDEEDAKVELSDDERMDVARDRADIAGEPPERGELP